MSTANHVRFGDFPRTGRVIARFSCGAASAVATKLAIDKYGDAVEIYNTDPGSEHDDNPRFAADCERWFGRKINVLRSDRYRDVDDVIERRHFLVGPKFAVCTEELKKFPGDKVTQIGDVEIYGYTVEERDRVERWRANNPERIIECPLIDRELTKEDCFGILDRVGIALPAMYLLGFDNNNCIGCVKARDHLNYWKRVRKHFPEVFARRAAQERKLGIAINRVTRDGVRSPIYLDGDPAGRPNRAGLGEDFMRPFLHGRNRRPQTCLNEAMKAPEDLATKWHCDKTATTTREVAGKFCTFKDGEAVRVLWDDGLTCCIERRNWNGELPLLNQLAGVPRLFLRF